MPRIIIVEGDHSFRKMLWLTLVKMGYEVVEAVNGSEAMKLHRCLPADVLMTDIIMTDQGGLETIQEFHHRHPQVKIIAISGQARTGARDSLGTARMLGATRILTKPFSIQEIACALKEMVPAYQDWHRDTAILMPGVEGQEVVKAVTMFNPRFIVAMPRGGTSVPAGHCPMVP